VWSNPSLPHTPYLRVERENVPYCYCLCNILHRSKYVQGIYLRSGRENSVGTATRYGLDVPGFQPQW
jgi:hypothetical protein